MIRSISYSRYLRIAKPMATGKTATPPKKNASRMLALPEPARSAVSQSPTSRTAAVAIHFSCARSSPRDRRKRRTTEIADARMSRRNSSQPESPSALNTAFAPRIPAGSASANVQALFLVGAAVFPVGIGFAILKYRLYEIDRIINRALVYGLLSALLAGLYFGIVIGLQAAFSSFTQGSELAVAGSTLAVAALFRPARRRIQATVDGRFYRRKVDAERTLAAFSARLRQEIDLEALSGELSAAVQETMQPAHVSLWLRAEEAHR